MDRIAYISSAGHDVPVGLDRCCRLQHLSQIPILLLLSPFGPTVRTHILHICSAILVDHGAILLHQHEGWDAANLEMLLDLFSGCIIKWHSEPIPMRFDHILDHVIMGPI